MKKIMSTRKREEKNERKKKFQRKFEFNEEKSLKIIIYLVRMREKLKRNGMKLENNLKVGEGNGIEREFETRK